MHGGGNGGTNCEKVICYVALENMDGMNNSSHFLLTKNLNNSYIKINLTPLNFVHLQVLISLPKRSLRQDQKR